MKRLTLSASPVLLLVVWGSALAARSAVAAPAALPLVPRFGRIEGTITLTRSGVISKANLQFQAPDQFRIEVERNDAALVPAQTVIASGDETRLFEPATRRVRRLPYNLAREWWRSGDLTSGGPANFLIFGLTSETLNRYYAAVLPAAANPTGAIIRYTARPGVGQLRVQDFVQFGGRATTPFYAAVKRTIFNRPARLEFTPDANSGNLTALTALDDNGRTLQTTAFTLNDNSLPSAATVKDGTGHLLAAFAYDLKARDAAFPAATFQTDIAPEQIVEDLELKPLSDYGGQDATTQFNLGVALARHTEDYLAAFAAWDTAARLQPKAIAPPLTTFDAALQTRDFNRAQTALDALMQLLGANDFQVATRRANLAIARRDWAGAQAALDAAQQAQPQNLAITIARADLARTRGAMAAADTLLGTVLTSPLSQPSAQSDAATLLANLVLVPDNPAATNASTGQAQWQQLARVQIALALAQNAPATTLESSAALAALASAYERAGQVTEAIASWQKVVGTASQAEATLAQMHLMNLQAQQGAVEESLKIYHGLAATTPDESARSRLEDALLASWRKAFRQEELRAALQQRVILLDASAIDWRLWLAYQQSYGSNEDVASTIQSGMGRFPKSAWWQSRWAEYLMDDATSQPETGPGLAKRTQDINDALQAVQSAIDAAPEQPFYPVQRTLIFTQRAAFQAAIMDANKNMANTRAAQEALNALQAAWKDDPDVEIAVAIQKIALDPGHLDTVIPDLQKGLRDGLPGRETLSGDRHTTASSVHQTLASAFRRLNRPNEATQQYEILLASVRDADTELSIARNYLILLNAQKNTRAIAALMMRLAHEPWPYAPARDLADGFAAAVATQKGRLPLDVLDILHNLPDLGARLAEAQLAQAILQFAKIQAAAPTATPDIKAAPTTMTKIVTTALQNLAPITQDADKIVAGRAAALLAEDALNAQRFDQALQWLQLAVATEPRDLDLRVALASAYRLANQPAGTVQTRNDILTALPRTVETTRRAATLSMALNLVDDAARYAVLALNLAQNSPDTSPVQVEDAALTAAQAFFNAGQQPRALTLYAKLADPQWDLQGRALALFDLEQRQRKAGHNAEADNANAQLQALHLTARQLQVLQQMLLSAQ